MRLIVLMSILILLIGGGYWYYHQKRLPNMGDWQQLTDSLTNTSKSTSVNDVDQALDSLAQRAQTVTSETQNVLGDAVQVNQQESQKPLSQRAVDRSLYLYCKSYVEEFEKTE